MRVRKAGLVAHRYTRRVWSYPLDGVAKVGRVLDDAQLATVRDEQASLAPHGVQGGYARIVHDGWRRSPRLTTLIGEVGAHACRATGAAELVLFHEHLLTKFPGGEDMGWHQDYSYVPLDRPDGVTLWIALDDVTEVNGCLYYLFGTHTRGERRPGWGLHGDDDVRAGLPAIDAGDEPGVPGIAPAGHALAHDPLLWHRSPANHGSEIRRTWVLSFVSPDARWCPRHAPHPRTAITAPPEGAPLEDDLPRVSLPAAAPCAPRASS